MPSAEIALPRLAPAHAVTAAWLVCAALLALPIGGAAQIPYSAQDIPIVPGTTRDPQAESKLRAGPDSNAQYLHAYRIGASIEQLFRYYLLRLNAQPTD